MTRAILGAGIGAMLMLSVPAAAQGGGDAAALAAKPIKGIQNVAITVSDIDATIAFYSKSIPYPVVQRFKVSARSFPQSLRSGKSKTVEVAVIETPTMFIQLMDFDPAKAASEAPRPVIGPGYTHICFQSSSKDPAILRFMAAGLNIISRFGKPDGVDIGGYGVRYAYGRDPDGIMIENESLDAPRRSEPTWVTHIANTVHDRDAMLAFYERLTGVAPHRRIEQEKRPRLDDVVAIDDISIKGGWLALGNMEIEVWQYVRPETPKNLTPRKLDAIGYSAIGFEVANVDEARQRLTKLAVPLAGKPVRIGDWRVQYAYDPEGNIFAVQQNVGSRPELSIDRKLWLSKPLSMPAR